MTSKKIFSMNFRLIVMIAVTFLLGGCYTFKDVSIPAEIQTVRVNIFENKARYVNPQLAPQLTERLRQKINNQTRLKQVEDSDADYDIYCKITNYAVTTSGISNQQSASNRLSVSVQIAVKNNKNPKENIESTAQTQIDFGANLSLQQAESGLMDDILRNLTDEIFNKIFSKW